MSLTIRSAELHDEGGIVALWRACDLIPSDGDPIADIRFAKSGKCSDVLIGTDDGGKVVGSVMVGHDGHRGWLYEVASAPDARGLGIGREMMAAAEDWLRQRGVQYAQLLVLETNTKVVSFYEHLGFQVSPRIVMRKKLS